MEIEPLITGEVRRAAEADLAAIELQLDGGTSQLADGEQNAGERDKDAVTGIHTERESHGAQPDTPEPLDVSTDTPRRPAPRRQKRKMTPGEILAELGNIDSDEELDDELRIEAPTLAAQEWIPEPPTAKTKRTRDITRVIKESSSRRESRERRLQGLSYAGNKTTYVDGKKKLVAREQQGVKMGPPCESTACQRCKNSKFCCVFTESDREKIFREFYALPTWSARAVFVQAMIDKLPTQRRTTDKENSPRNTELIYKLKKDGVSVRVCRSFFLSTLGLTASRMRNWVARKPSLQFEERERVLRESGRELFKEAAAKLERFLSRLATLPSHYGRAHSKLKYLEHEFTSQSQVYRLYLQRSKALNRPSVSYGTFHAAFKAHNLAIHHPKKDQCNTCAEAETGGISVEELAEHRAKVTLARKEKDADKDNEDVDVAVFWLDKMANTCLPRMMNSLYYYLTKLQVNIQTFYNLKTKDCVHYVWTEVDGGLKASVFASIQLDHLDLLLVECANLRIIILWSDGAAAQNRNQYLSNALLQAAARHTVTIQQKYGEVGHTQSECDSAHSNVSRALKDQKIYSLKQYMERIVHARSAGYEVRMCNYTFFRDYTKVAYYKSIRPAGDNTVTDLRAIQYNTDFTIDYKLRFSDEWTRMPKRPAVREYATPPLYPVKPKITERKYKSLVSLLRYMPKKFHSFYKALNPKPTRRAN